MKIADRKHFFSISMSHEIFVTYLHKFSINCQLIGCPLFYEAALSDERRLSWGVGWKRRERGGEEEWGRTWGRSQVPAWAPEGQQHQKWRGGQKEGEDAQRECCHGNWGRRESWMRDWTAMEDTTGRSNQKKTKCNIRHGMWDCAVTLWRRASVGRCNGLKKESKISR